MSVAAHLQETFLGILVNEISMPLLVKPGLLGLASRCCRARHPEILEVAHGQYNGQGQAVLELQEKQFDETPRADRWRYCRKLQEIVPTINVYRALQMLDADGLASFITDVDCLFREEALEVFLNVIRPYIVKCAGKTMHVRGEESINEIVVRVNVRLYRSLWDGNYEENRRIFGFIRETTRQESLCLFKENRRREKLGIVQVQGNILDGIAISEFDPMSGTAIDLEAVQIVLSGMNEKDRILLCSIYKEGNSVTEVAIRLGWSVDKVRRKLAAACETFRQRWRSKFGDPN